MPERVRAHEAAGRYVEVDGQRVFVREAGEGTPVLLLHGVPASSYLYRKMLEPLAAAGWRAIAFDFPGLGLSDKPKGAAYDWHALAGWLGLIVDALALETVHLVVHDIGGPIGVEWAIGAPERVRSMTILNTPLDVAHFSPPFPMSLFRLPGLRHLTVRLNSVGFFHALMKRRGVKHAERFEKADTAAYLWLMRHDGGASTFLDVMAGFDLSASHGDFLRDGLQRAPYPLQMVWGEHEIAIPEAQMRYVEETFDLRAIEKVDGRHFIQEDRAEVVADHIDRFCKDVDAERTPG